MVTALFEPRWRVWPRSLRWQLQAWQAFLSICMLAAFGVAVYELLADQRFRQVDADLQMRVGALRRTISEGRRRDEPPRPPRRHGGPPPGPLGPTPAGPPAAGHVLEDFAISPELSALFGSEGGFYFVIWSRDGNVVRHSENAPAASPRIAALERDSLPHVRTWGSYRELVHCSGVGDCVVAGRSVAEELRNATAVTWLLPLAAGAVLLIGLAVGWGLITRAVRPVEEIEATAAEISKGRLSVRVPIHNPESELGQLAVVLNTTFARLEAAFERQRQFTSDAAHELRTPLAIMISEAQTALARPRDAEGYKQALEDCLDTAQQMRRLTGTLLDLARLDMDNANEQRTEIDLADIARRCIGRLQPLAASQRITFKQELSRATVINIADRIELVVMNLLLNAIDYNRPGGEVAITTRNGGPYNTLCVADTGVGIEPADLPRIFDRFYRADKVGPKPPDTLASDCRFARRSSTRRAELSKSKARLERERCSPFALLGDFAFITPKSVWLDKASSARKFGHG